MFPMKVEITIRNAVQLQTLAALLAGDFSKLPENQVGLVAEDKSEVESEAKPEAKPDIPETVAIAKVEDAPNTPAASTETTYTLDDAKKLAKKLTMKIVADKGRDVAIELLAKFGVKVAANVPDAQVYAFCQNAEEILNG